MRLELLDPLPLYLGTPKRLQPPPAPAEVPSDGYSRLLGAAIPSPKVVTPRPAEVEAAEEYRHRKIEYTSGKNPPPKSASYSFWRNHGAPWTPQLDYELGQLWELSLKTHNAATAIVEIAKRMERTTGSIFSRLKVLGYAEYDPSTNRFEVTQRTGKPMRRGPLD